MTPVLTGRILATVAVNGEKVPMNATVVGYAMTHEPWFVEIMTTDGRSTIVKLDDVTPLDENAKTLLAGSPSSRFR